MLLRLLELLQTSRQFVFISSCCSFILNEWDMVLCTRTYQLTLFVFYYTKHNVSYVLIEVTSFLSYLTSDFKAKHVEFNVIRD